MMLPGKLTGRFVFLRLLVLTHMTGANLLHDLKSNRKMGCIVLLHSRRHQRTAPLDRTGGPGGSSLDSPLRREKKAVSSNLAAGAAVCGSENSSVICDEVFSGPGAKIPFLSSARPDLTAIPTAISTNNVRFDSTNVFSSSLVDVHAHPKAVCHVTVRHLCGEWRLGRVVSPTKGTREYDNL